MGEREGEGGYERNVDLPHPGSPRRRIVIVVLSGVSGVVIARAVINSIDWTR